MTTDKLCEYRDHLFVMASVRGCTVCYAGSEQFVLQVDALGAQKMDKEVSLTNWSEHPQKCRSRGVFSVRNGQYLSEVLTVLALGFSAGLVECSQFAVVSIFQMWSK